MYLIGVSVHVLLTEAFALSEKKVPERLNDFLNVPVCVYKKDMVYLHSEKDSCINRRRELREFK